MGTKNVVFEYYRVYCREYNKDTNLAASESILCDITPILEKAQSIDVTARSYQVNGEESRLQCVDRNKINSNIWNMSFIRMRENVIPRNSKKYRRI